MSEENTDNSATESTVATNTESTDNATVADGAQTVSSTNSDRPAGYAPVDPATASPEQVKERLDYLYGQVKHTGRENREMQNLLRDQSRIINELSEGQRAVVNHLTEKSFVDNEEHLTRQMQEAWQRQDNKAYIDAQNKLLDMRIQQRVQANQPQVRQQQNNQMPANAAEIANRAVQTGEINHDEYRATESWQNEKNDNGDLVRPWAYASDPAYQAALLESRSVLSNPRFANLSYQQKLEEIDRRMGVQKRTVSQNVIGGSLTKPGKGAKLQLSDQQRKIAIKTQYAGKGKSEADHLEKYRQQIDKIQNRRAK